MLVRTLLALLPFLMLADGETSGGKDDADTDATADRDDASADTADDTLGDKGKEALRREREARKVAEKERTDLQKRIADFEKRQREADETKAKEEGDYKRLLDEREKELADLKAEQARNQIARLREKYGAKERIPEALWTKIDGDDEDAIKADAKALAKHLGGPQAPEDDAGERSRVNGKTTKKNDAYKDPSHWL